MLMEIRFAVVFKVDGLNLKETCEMLKKYGEVTEVMDENLNGEDVKIILMSSNLGGFLRIQRELNTVPANNSEYVLFPMESFQAKMEVLKARE